jgi:phosphoinositide-3-kinase regulatory subunit 4
LAKKAKQKNTVHSSLDELLTETEDFLRQLDSGVFVSNVDDLLEDQTDQMLPKTLSKLGHILQSPSEFNSMSQPSPSQSSVIILLQVVLSSVGHVLRPSSKYVALVLSKLSIN